MTKHEDHKHEKPIDHVEESLRESNKTSPVPHHRSARGTEQRPSIGRIVRYRFGGLDHAAIVSSVVDDRRVNLCVINPSGDTFGATSIEIADAADQDGRWSWPTY